MTANALTTQSAAVPAATSGSLVESLRAYAAANNVRTHSFLSFNGKLGSYQTKDTDNNTIDLPLGTKMAVNLADMMHGHVCWVDRQKKDETFVNILQHPAPIDVATLTDHGPYIKTDDGKRNDGWQEQIKIPMKDLSTGREYIFSTGSKSSTRAARNFIGALIAASVAHDLITEAPVMTINRSQFKSRGGDNVPVPAFKLIEWTGLDKANFTKPIYGSANIDDETQAASGAAADVRVSAEDAVVVD